ncbi:hypothetical protein VP01_3102g2 [Puccinia sorghi]|uniref:Uncharacterized protein n=1 Tax=Puccinia sorghi TaxID=27349 RepID=A0A0L6V195_9BASI|nr:hypothetical protein VP01_3102g2 [Puccinia sorghi]
MTSTQRFLAVKCLKMELKYKLCSHGVYILLPPYHVKESRGFPFLHKRRLHSISRSNFTQSGSTGRGLNGSISFFFFFFFPIIRQISTALGLVWRVCACLVNRGWVILILCATEGLPLNLEALARSRSRGRGSFRSWVGQHNFINLQEAFHGPGHHYIQISHIHIHPSTTSNLGKMATPPDSTSQETSLKYKYIPGSSTQEGNSAYQETTEQNSNIQTCASGQGGMPEACKATAPRNVPNLEGLAAKKICIYIFPKCCCPIIQKQYSIVVKTWHVELLFTHTGAEFNSHSTHGKIVEFCIILKILDSHVWLLVDASRPLLEKIIHEYQEKPLQYLRRASSPYLGLFLLRLAFFTLLLSHNKTPSSITSYKLIQKTCVKEDGSRVLTHYKYLRSFFYFASVKLSNLNTSSTQSTHPSKHQKLVYSHSQAATSTCHINLILALICMIHLDNYKTLCMLQQSHIHHWTTLKCTMRLLVQGLKELSLEASNCFLFFYVILLNSEWSILHSTGIIKKNVSCIMSLNITLFLLRKTKSKKNYKCMGDLGHQSKFGILELFNSTILAVLLHLASHNLPKMVFFGCFNQYYNYLFNLTIFGCFIALSQPQFTENDLF